MEKEQPAAKHRAPRAHWWLFLSTSNNNYEYHQFFMAKLKHGVYPI